MTVAHHELVWNCLPDMRSEEQRSADAEIDRVSRDEPDVIKRLYQDIIALTTELDDRVMAKNNQPILPCPSCTARENATRDLVAEASLRLVQGALRRTRRSRIARLRVVAAEAQLVLAVA